MSVERIMRFYSFAPRVMHGVGDVTAKRAREREREKVKAREDVSLSSAFPRLQRLHRDIAVKYCIIDDPGVRSKVRRIRSARVRAGRLSHLYFNTP